MIIVGSRLRVIDNSGARGVECIRVLNKSKSKLAKVGDYIVVTVKTLKHNLPKKKVSKHQVTKAIILNTRNPIMRKNGVDLKNVQATVALIDREKLTPIGTRLASGVSNEIREKGLIKVLVLARGLI